MEEQEVTETDLALAWIVHVAAYYPNQWCFMGPCSCLKPFLKSILSATATAAFHITQLYHFLIYIAKAANGQCTTAWNCDSGCLKTWNKFQLQLHSIFCSQMIMPSQVVQAAPPSGKFPMGNCDAMITQSIHGDQSFNLIAQYYKIVDNPGNQPAISWQRLSAIIPITDVTHAVELIPVYGEGANHMLYECFYLNNFSDKKLYHSLHSDFN
ncbi:uncharacterized protein EDB93DRAFT_1243610 [Suillus bovinus]|uniref:uncharacterized protein n=1 Tax=Suillus bovinus TaxID=48563 RepID=UPI001B8748F4|nr:uncharacterized protein EDB93DRAFT_1243610 [Suillus bovinus]KAG2128056.1 hypothetical protein EDB93DRAFT_1243610 [Suillus bovinus]